MLDMHKILIVADGDFQSETFIQTARTGKTLLALDGAANKLVILGIKPDIVTGDLDSIRPQLLASLKQDTDIIQTPDQNKTDLVKAIEYCDQQQCNQIDIICATGGKLDLHEANLRTLKFMHCPERSLAIHTASQSLYFVKDNTIKFNGHIGDQCGILAYPKGTATSSGLYYELNDFPLEFAISESISNRLDQPSAIVSIKGEALIITPLQLK